MPSEKQPITPLRLKVAGEPRFLELSKTVPTLIYRQLSFIKHIRRNARSTKRTLTRTFADPAAQSECIEVRMAFLLTNGVNNRIHGAFGNHFTFTQEDIFRFMLFQPQFGSQCRFGPFGRLG